MKMEIRSRSDLYRYRLFVFDLDDTIYREEDYLLQGYDAVSRHLSEKTGCGSSDYIFDRLVTLFREQGRHKLFDTLLEELDCDKSLVASCVDVLRTFRVKKKLEMCPEVAGLLQELKGRNKKVYILTNGNPVQQRNKISNINWGNMTGYPVTVFADELSPKPSPAGIEQILLQSGIKETDTILIGDSEVDMQCAANAGIAFINVTSVPLH